MARDYYDESKPKKKKKETPKPQKVTKSPSVTKVNNKASNSTFMGGGSSVKKVEQRQGAAPKRQTTTTTPKRTTMTDAQYQKTYGEPRRATAQRTSIAKPEPVRRTTNHRLTAAQTQKMYGTTNPKLQTAEESRREREERRKEREERRLAAQRQKSGLNDQPTAAQKAATDRALKNTLPIAKESAKGAVYGHLTTLNDIASIKSQGKGKSREEIYDPNLAEKSRQQAEKRVKKLQAKTQETEDAIQKLTKNAKGLEKAYYGAVESGTGMLTDVGIGALTGTGQVGSLAAMYSRTYGSTRGKAQKEGATQAEDRAYAAAQAAKEVGTELMFPGAGLARGYAGKQGLKLADTAANILTKNLRGKAADIGGAGVRLIGGVLEENAEEVAGWGLDPLIKEITYGKKARTRNAQQAMKERSNALRAEIQNEDDARAAAAYLSSDDFFEQTVNAYREAGLSKKDAEEVANRMRDYLTASLTGDTDSMEQIEDEVSKKVAGSKKLEWDFDELKDTIASTTLLTAATGLPGTGMTAVKGAALRDQLGDDGVRALANTAIDFEDSEMSLKAKAMKARLDSGNELTSTQVYDLQVGMQEQIRKDTQREESSRRMADKRIKSDNLLTPYRQNENGGIDLDEATEASYREQVSRAKDIIDGLTSETKESLTANEKVDGSKAIAGFQTGVFTIEDANTLNYSNTTVRAAFEEATGVDLGQYVVKNKDGSVNIPATNTKTKDALFAMAADNLVKSAQAETQNWMDNAKGQVVTQVSARMGASGSAVLQQALDDVDERDRSKYMMTTNAADMMYQAARNMGTEWSDIAPEATRMFPGISESKLKMMYEAGLADREMANDKARGRQVRMGQALSEMGEQETATGKVFIDTEVPVKGSVIRAFTEIAKNLGADIHFVDYIYDAENNPIAGANGSYDPNTNTFYLNVATGAETNIGYIFMHETTHYLKTYAPEQYQALENLVRERWFAFNPSQMQDAIARKIEAYKRATKGQQVLTEEQALEEIIADASHDFINDPEFAKQVAEEDMGLAKAVLDSIRNALRMLRRIFASGSIDDDTHMNSLFRELDIMAEAEKLWLDAYKTAVRNSAVNAVDNWQNDANEQSRLSVAEDKWNNDEKLTKAKFNSFYSAHKLTYGRATKENIDDVVEKIKSDGFISTTAIANVVPASINDYVDPEKPNLTQSKYGAKEGDVVMFVPNKYVDLKNDIIKNGYKPRDYEIVEVERDYQPYYELYSKAYDEAHKSRYSISDKSYDELTEEEQRTIHEAVSPDIRFSMPTERDVLPKARYKSDIGFSNAISAISGKQARINALVKNGFSEKQAKQIGEAISNVILDTGNWIEGDLQSEFTFIGWDDLINAEVSVRKDWKGKVVGVSVSAMVANGEYPVNFDLTTICNKREGIMQVIQNLTRIKTDTGKSVLDSVKLTDQDMWNINKALKAEGIDTACLGCFVEARRYYTNRFIASIDNKWNTAVRETRRQLGLPEEEYFNFAHGKKVTGEDYTAISDLWTSYEKSKDTKKSPEQRIRILMNEIIKNNEVDSPYLKLVSASDILTPEGISGLKQISTGKHDLVKTLKSIYGTSAPKEILAFTPYNSEIALLPKNLKGQRTDKYLRSIGGIRIQSFSDFKIEHVIDHMQMVADMAARKFTCHAYSKVIAFPRIFGLTGQKINMSVMFDITPAEEWQTLLGCSEEKAKEYAFKYAGLRFVTEKPAENPDNRPYIETDLEGVHGYLTYLLGDADYINSVYEEEYQKNIAAGMDENKARRKANEAKPFEQSINYREAVELENQEGYKENVGIIAVAYGDEHLKILLADPNVRYVIPYHKSGLPVFVSEKTSLQYARNYEPVQNTKKADPKEKLQERFNAFKKKYKGEYPAIAFFGDIYENGGSIATTEATATEAAKLHGTGEFDVYKDLDKAKDIKEVANAYLEDCIENNLVPVFSEFAGDPNYYKMLFDFAVTDGTSDHIYPQKTVRNNYPGIDVDAKIAAGEKITEDDYAKLRKAIRKGALEENVKNQTRSENMQNVLDDILSKDSENSILAGTNVNAIRDSATDYTDPKGIKYSITPEMDEAYMDAYFDGDDDAMQDLVDQAAKMAGYGESVYHGTGEYFNVFRLGREGIHLGNIEQAEQVARNRYHDRSRETRYKWGEIKDRISEMDTETRQSLINRLERTSAHAPIFDGDISDAELVKAYAEDALQKYYGTQTDINNKSVLMRTFDRNVGENVMRMYARLDNPFVINGDILDWTPWNIANTLLHKADGDTEYRDDFTERRIDISGSDLNLGKWTRKAVEQIANGEVKGDEAWRLLDGVLEQAGGYHGIKYLNQFEGDKNSYSYIALNRSDVKLADPVTYAEDGSVIPLSERFDPTNNDIRYSLPTQDSDGNILTDGQMEYFKNSQARDAEGRLVPVYHTTNKGGFTIFDPMKSDDHRSLFFAEDWDTSQTYGNYANSRFYYFDIDNIDDVKKYLDAYSPDRYFVTQEQFDQAGGWEADMLDFENVTNGEQSDFAKYLDNPDGYIAIIGVPDYSPDNTSYADTWVMAKSPDELVRELHNHFGWQRDNYRMGTQHGYYACYLNLEDPYIIDAHGDNWNEIHLDDYDDDVTFDTREIAEMAMDMDFDGVIIRNLVDHGGMSPYDGMFDYSDIYIAFSSNQVKDINNENPTENPDIRYSFSDEDDLYSYMASVAADSMTNEELAYYEQIAETEEKHSDYLGKMRKWSEEKISEFYESLVSNDEMPSENEKTEEGRIRMSKAREDFFNSLDTKWNDKWLSNGEVLDVKSVKSKIKQLIIAQMRGANATRQYKTEVLNRTLFDVRTAYMMAKRGRIEVADEIIWNSARNMIANLEFVEERADYETFKEIRDFVKGRRIQIDEGDFPSHDHYKEFLKSNFGRMTLVKDGTGVDQVWQALNEKYGNLFPEEVVSPLNQLEWIADYLNSYEPIRWAYSSEQAAALAFDIADELGNIVFGYGKPIESLADHYKSKYEEKAKALKARCVEAERELRRTRRENESNEAKIARLQEKNKRIEKKLADEKQKAKDKAAKKKDVKERARYTGRIQKNYDWLTKRLLQPTKDKNIPEGFRKDLARLLCMFDLQTERSKELEKKYGIPSQKTFKMWDLHSKLCNVMNEDNGGIFQTNAYIEFLSENLAKRIDGKSIDSLETPDLLAVDEYLKIIVHQFREYDKVRVGEKRVKLEDLGGKVIQESDDRVSKRGQSKEYGGLIKALDSVVNFAELTPIHFFQRMGTMYTMYKEVRKSFDKYIRNEKYLLNKIQNICGEYYTQKKNRPGSELEAWRDSRSAQELRLKNGTVTMTVAQMMSLYCLSKRNQALLHMTKDGIVITPITEGAKIEKARADIKGRKEQIHSIQLTLADIDLIKTKLTPDQMKIADKLQELMSGEMAEWGNEMSMKLYGIRMFKEKDYFPIKVSSRVTEQNLDDIDITETIKNFGFTKPTQPNARNAIEVDDIFKVVADHCNNMNLYNAYGESISDFWRVFNYKQYSDEGKPTKTVQQALEEAYGKKAIKYIKNFIKDINGNVAGKRSGGLEEALNATLGKAKKAAVFGNMRVALQQPTAIVRAFAVLNPKYIGAIRVHKGAMQEMFEHCPIAQWKSWGFYDTYMGRDIEDVMMNKWSMSDTALSGIYGQLDNITWTAIWQMCKAEVKDTHPNVKEGTQEFWDLCNERASEVFDKTQVVDSPFHRSDAMRSKDIMVKSLTSFQSEPTLTFNVVRSGFADAADALRNGNKAEFTKKIAGTVAVFVAQAAVVSATAAIWDAVRRKNPDGGDDDDKKWVEFWTMNFFNNLKDNINLLNNIYLVKEIMPYIDKAFFGGYGASNNLLFQSLDTLTNGITQFQKKLEKGDAYDKSWYDVLTNLFGGFGYMFGIPVKTLMKDFKGITSWLGINVLAADEESLMDSVAEKMGYKPIEKTTESKWFDYERNPLKVTDGSTFDNILNHFGWNLTEREKEQIAADEAAKAQAAKADEIAGKTADLTGEARDKKVWSYVTSYMKAENGDKPLADVIQEGDYKKVQEYRDMYVAAGGNTEYFDQRIFDTSKSAMKKTIVYDPTDQQIDAQDKIKGYLLTHGMDEAELSEMAYKSYTAKDMKIAFIINDKDAMLETLEPLVRAGLSYEDLERIWKNRNRIDVMKYKSSKGRYADRLKSTGKFIWPTDGQITSYFGYRNAPTAGASSNHPAIDIGAPMGTDVVAADGGVVIYAGTNGGYGNSVGIKHDNGMVTYYNHLSAWNVNVGDTVVQGQQIANVGSTGISTGPHLDFKILDGDGEPVDPLKYLASRS